MGVNFIGPLLETLSEVRRERNFCNILEGFLYLNNLVEEKHHYASIHLFM